MKKQTFRLKDLKKDRVFRHYFKRYKDDLIHLLNSFLPLPDKTAIKKIKLLDDQFQPDDFTKKESLMDIRVDLDSQGLANVEMQRVPEKYFRSRVLFYASRLLGSQLEKGAKYERIQPVYSLLFCERPLFPELKEHYSVFSLRCDTRPEILWTRDLRLVLVQLDQFRKSLDNLVDNVDRWCYILNKAPQLDEGEFKRLSGSGGGFGGIMWHLRKLSEDEKAKVLEEYEDMRWRDEQARLDSAEERGMKKGMQQGMEQGMQQGIEQGVQQGMEKGREEGIQQGMRQTALRMLKKDLDPAQISEWTGLSEEEVKALKKRACF